MSKEVIIDNRRVWIPNLREIWEHRLLLFALVNRNVKLRYKQTLLGVIWVIIQPLALSGVFTILFGKFISVSSGEIPYICFALAGVAIWQFFSRALAESSVSLVSFSNVISKVYFPRILIPLASVLTAVFDFLIVLLITLAVTLAINGEIPLRSLWGIPCFVGIAFLTSFGLGLCLSGLNVIFRDIQHTVPFVLQMGLYLSPVVYPVSVIPEKWQTLYYCNPMVGIIEGFRWSLFVNNAFPDPLSISISLISLTLLLITGFLIFYSVEHTMIDRI